MAAAPRYGVFSAGTSTESVVSWRITPSWSPASHAATYLSIVSFTAARSAAVSSPGGREQAQATIRRKAEAKVWKRRMALHDAPGARAALS
jgi:hypothetical protein